MAYWLQGKRLRNGQLDAYSARLADPTGLERAARRVTETMMPALQGGLLVPYVRPAMADAFCANSLNGSWTFA